MDALRRTAEYYSLPVLDLYATSGLQPKVPVIQEMYVPDGLHPNSAGHRILADKIVSWNQTVNSLGGIDAPFLSNHDQTRSAGTLPGMESKKQAAAVYLLLPGNPFIYYGDELGQTSGSGDFSKRESFDWYKSGLGEGMTDNKKACGADPSYTLPDDGISLEEQKDNIDSIYNYYKKLISIRKENPIMFYGTYETVGWNNGLYAYSIKGAKDGSTLLIIHNNKEKAIDYVVSEGGKELITDIDIKSGETVSVGAYGTLIIKY